MRKFFFKVFIIHLCVILLLSFFIYIFFFNTLKKSYVDNNIKFMTEVSNMLNNQIGDLISQREDLDIFLKGFAKNASLRFTVIDPNGEVLADSITDPSIMENHSNRIEIERAKNGKVFHHLRFSNTLKEDMIYLAMPVYRDNAVSYIIRTSVFYGNIKSDLNRLRERMLRIILIIVIISVLLLYFISKDMDRPIKTLINATNKISEGDFNVRVILNRKDEFSLLAENFNSMARDIKNTFNDMNDQKEKLHTIIRSMEEGLLVIDGKGNMIIYNDALLKIIGEKGPVNGYYGTYLRNKTITDTIDEIIKGGNEAYKEIEMDGNEYLCSFKRTTNDQIIVVLNDVGRYKDLERLKRDLVLNISHELRTPLTSIKGFLETMEEEENANKEYIDIIKRNTERLINIVNDLLVLSSIEQKKEMEKVDIDIKTLINTVLKIFEKKIKEKELDLILKLEDDLPNIEGDEFQLEQVFINLLDNAVKYTEAGRIEIIAKKENEIINIIFKDTGIGIPKDKQDRIFERFFVVDKSRSKKMGGTGLGLSIVKHIILLHKGTISIKSEISKGAEFHIELPIKN